jgi:hypothetical protein
MEKRAIVKAVRKSNQESGAGEELKETKKEKKLRKWKERKAKQQADGRLTYAACKLVVPRDEFSNAQQRKGKQRRCCSCIDGGSTTAARSKPPSRLATFSGVGGETIVIDLAKCDSLLQEQQRTAEHSVRGCDAEPAGARRHGVGDKSGDASGESCAVGE